MFVALIV